MVVHTSNGPAHTVRVGTRLKSDEDQVRLAEEKGR